ncbi:MAG: DUF364 domain-containing protein [Calditrichaeota bacterium]|nr:DUF364 domain-containing protein [Calditrichota bacterium]
MILDETYTLLKLNYKKKIENLSISDVRLGIHLCAVKLSDNSFGVASTLYNGLHSVHHDRDFSEFSPLQIKNRMITDLFESGKNNAVSDTLKTAVLNAVSSQFLAAGSYRIIENIDPLDLLDLKPGQKITMVGAFTSYMQKINNGGAQLTILELNKDAVPDAYKKYYKPADHYPLVIPGADIIIITGLTLVNHTLDDLLAVVSEKSKVIVTGPSSSLIPDILFEKKVGIIGATRIINPDQLFDLVSQAGAGYHLFKYECAQKICIINE